MTAQRLDPNKQSADIGAIPTRGGFVYLDEPFNIPVNPDTPELDTTAGEFSTWIYVGNGGDIFAEMEDGSINPFIGVPSGTWIICKARRVLSSCTLDTVIRITTASEMTWKGGQ
jgi:hypothetical protein